MYVPSKFVYLLGGLILSIMLNVNYDIVFAKPDNQIYDCVSSNKPTKISTPILL